MQSSADSSVLSSQLRWSPQNREDAAYRRMLCGRGEHERAASAVEPLLDLQVVVAPRAGQEGAFAGGFRSVSVRQLLDALQRSVQVVCYEANGQWNEVPPDVHLKGGLASKAILGQDLCEAVLGGADIDLQIDAFQWVAAQTSASDCTALTGRIATVWIASLFKGVEPEEALAMLQRSDSLRALIFQKFFTSRVAIGPAYSPQPNPQAECWTLYGVRLRLPGGGETHLDLTAIFRSARPFLSNDAAFQVRLPLGGAPVEVTSWLTPKEGLRCVAEGTFTIPDLDQVQSGALEKVLSKLARGCRYNWDDPRAQQMMLLRHFQRACGGTRRREPWEAIALAKLRDIPQSSWTPWQRIALTLQLVQLFPHWVTLEWWPDGQLWPEGLQPLQQMVRTLEGPQRAAVLQALAPLLSTRLQALGLTACPAWLGEPCQFLDLWLSSPPHSRLRRMVTALELSAADGPVDAALVEEWFHRRAESAAPDQDSKLLLALLAEAPIEPEHKELMAAQICLEVTVPGDLESRLAKWPSLWAGVRRSPALHQRGFCYLTDLERRGLWLEAFACSPVFFRLLESVESVPVAPAARLRAIWTALDRLVAAGEPLPENLCQKALEGLASGMSSPLQMRVLPEMLFQQRVALHRLPLVFEWMRNQLGRELETALLGREIRAWLHLMAQSPGLLQAGTVQVLFDAIDRRRWQEPSVRVEEALIRAMAQARPSGEAADGWVRMVAHQAVKRPHLWDTLCEQMLPELGWEGASIVLEALSQQHGWTPALVDLLTRWLQDPERGLEAAQLAAQRGWPLSLDQRWRVWTANVVRTDSEGAVHEAISRLQQHIAEAEALPPEPQQQQLEQWIKKQSGLWSKSRRQRRGLAAGAALWQAAESWRSKWGDDRLLQAVLQGLWAQGVGSDAGAASRALVLQIPAGVDEREVLGALLCAILRSPEQFPHQERLPGSMLLQAATHHPELLEELLLRPAYGIRGALMALSLEEHRAIWLPLLRGLSCSQLREVAEQTGMMAPLEPRVPAASPQWLEAWRLLLDRLEDRRIEQGWIELCGRSVGLLCADPMSQPVLELALRGCGRLLVVRLLANSAFEALPRQTQNRAESSMEGVNETILWETLAALSQALAMRGRTMAMDPMHLPLFIRVLSDRVVVQPNTLALTLARASLIEPGLAAQILAEVLRRLRAAGARGASALLSTVRGSTEVFRVLMGEPESGRLRVVKQILLAMESLQSIQSHPVLERAALSAAVPCWMVCISSSKLDGELLDALQTIQERTLGALEEQMELDPAERNRTGGALSALLAQEEGLPAGSASHGSTKVVSAEVLLEMSYSAMARIACFLCQDSERRVHFTLIQERLNRLAQGLEGPSAEGARQLAHTLAALSWSMYMECGSVVEERALRQQTMRALEGVGSLHAITRERVVRGMVQAVKSRTDPVELEQTLALRVLAIFWTTATGQTTSLPELMKDLEDIDWSCHPEVVEEAGQIVASAFLGFADLCKLDAPIKNLWLQLEKIERPLLLDQVMLETGALLAGEPSGIRPWMEILGRANRRLEQEASGSMSYQQELARALLLRSTARASCIVAAEVEQVCRDQPELVLEVQGMSQGYLEKLVQLESGASERVPELLFAILRQHVSGFVGLGEEGDSLNLSKLANTQERERCRKALAKNLPVLAEALIRVQSGPRLIRAYTRIMAWLATPAFQGCIAQLPWLQSMPHQLMERIHEEYSRLYVRAELEAVGSELPHDSALEQLLGLAGPLLEIPLGDVRALNLLTMFGAWIGSLGQRAPALESQFVWPQLRQIGSRLIAWLMSWKPSSEDYSLLEMLAAIPEPTLQRTLSQWCEHHRSSLKQRSQKAAFAAVETRVVRMQAISRIVAIQAAEASRAQVPPAAAAGSSQLAPTRGAKRR